MQDTSKLPIIYSLRNCPYAMRARIAIFKAQLPVLIRDLVLSNKPAEMLLASPKGTVPVVVESDGTVIEESLDVMLWALKRNDPNMLLGDKDSDALNDMLALISSFDNGFKGCLEQYRCAKRYKEDNVQECRHACEQYIKDLESRLSNQNYLMSNSESLADIALVPFIRQFAKVERQWYLNSPYINVRQWLNSYLQSPMFTKVMAKYPLWQEEKQDIIFADM